MNLLPTNDSVPDTKIEKGHELSLAVTVTLIDPQTALCGRFRTELSELNRLAVEPNVSFEPSIIEAALETVAERVTPKFYAVRARCGALIAMFPLITVRSPIFDIRRLWRHEFPFSGAPLVHRDYVITAFIAFFRTLTEHAQQADVVEIPNIPLEGPLICGLRNAAQTLNIPTAVSNARLRPMFRVPSDFAAYERSALSGRRRRTLARLRRQLERLGDLQFIEARAQSECQKWFEEYIAIEQVSWKSKIGTTIDANSKRAEFHRRVVCALSEDDRYRIYALALNGTPIAVALGLGGPDNRTWLCKTTYDESYSHFSPGVQLILALGRALSQNRDCAWLDSCADADDSFVSTYWSERIRIGNVSINPRRNERRFATALKSVAAAKTARRKFTPIARTIIRKPILFFRQCLHG